VYVDVYWEMPKMRTNVVLNDELINEALKMSDNIKTKKELIEVALREYVQNRKGRSLKDLKGKISFVEDYDYKSMRK